MVAMVVAAVLTCLVGRYAARKQLVTIPESIIAATVGLTLGTALDVVAWRWDLWSYTRHPYWQWSYWAVLPAMWTLFGIGTYTLWRLLCPSWLTIPFSLSVYEGYGLMRGSWTYSPSWPVVVAGWVPLILSVVVLTVVAEQYRKRRRVEWRSLL